jgi:hypothetical protein
MAFLVLLTSLAGSPRPLLTKVQVRILLLVPLVLVTLIVHIFHGTWNAPFAQIFPSWKVVFRDMFLYIDVHLILLYLLTYLPFIWKPSSGKRPVISPSSLL